MATGISLHIGLNAVNPTHYHERLGRLVGAEFDAKDMELILTSMGFQTTVLLGIQATRANVRQEIGRAAQAILPGDIFVVSYSGHGGQVPDANSDEDDGVDETWCLYDGQLIDDELQQLWRRFCARARIVVISDSCHSGTIVREISGELMLRTSYLTRNLPNEVAASTYMNHRSFYDEIQANVDMAGEIQASMILLSACQDNQFALDGPFNGRFTAMMKRVWNGGRFSGDYKAFWQGIMRLLPSEQSPNYFTLGPQNNDFLHQKPFTI